MNSKKGNVVLILILIIALLVAASGFFYLLGKSQGSSPATLPPAAVKPQAPTTVATASSAPPAMVNPQPPLPDPNIKTFSSADLGISFNYLENQGGEKFAAGQVGDKVYVYWTAHPMDQGQYVEVFTKDKNDDLKTAIQKKFLVNYSPNDCFAEIAQNPVAKQPTPATFVLAEIQVPTTPNDDMETLSAKWDKCPTPYTATNGIAYFATDTNHPNKFVFFSIGQYGIDGGPNNLLWQSTLKFL